MIELVNVDKSVAIKFQIVGYQFIEEVSSGDDDWCNLEINLKHNGKLFNKVDPAIDANELNRLYQWFYSLSINTLPRYAHLSFTEPCISFKFLAKKNSTTRIAINLSHELKPKFKLTQLRQESNDWNIVFELSEKDFKSILNSLSDSIKKYPVRNKANK